MAQTAESEKGLKRTLGVWSLIALGIGAIIGAGCSYGRPPPQGGMPVRP